MSRRLAAILAEPGGICVSSIVHESLGKRVDIDFSEPEPMARWRPCTGYPADQERWLEGLRRAGLPE